MTAKRRAVYPPKHCPECGEEMPTETSPQRRKIYCGPRCRTRGTSRKLSGRSQPSAPSYEPTPQQLEEAKAEVRAGWTEQEWLRACGYHVYEADELEAAPIHEYTYHEIFGQRRGLPQT